MSKTVQEGGCLCGNVRYRTSDNPVRVMACHCTTCKKRTGAAFGVGVYFDDGDVEFTSGERNHYRFNSDTSGRWIENEYCKRCGTSVSWTLELRPGLRGIAGGTYDDPRWFDIEAHIWTRSACNGMSYPDAVEVFEEAIA